MRELTVFWHNLERQLTLASSLLWSIVHSPLVVHSPWESRSDVRRLNRCSSSVHSLRSCWHPIVLIDSVALHFAFNPKTQHHYLYNSLRSCCHSLCLWLWIVTAGSHLLLRLNTVIFITHLIQFYSSIPCARDLVSFHFVATSRIKLSKSGSPWSILLVHAISFWRSCFFMSHQSFVLSSSFFILMSPTVPLHAGPPLPQEVR